VFGKFFLKRRSVFCNDEIALLISDRTEEDRGMGIIDSYVFDIYDRKDSRKAGYVSLRIGESPYLYYLGHIGYRIDEDYRGRHYSEKACRLILPLIRSLDIHSLCITNNPDNMASRRTCERLGCELESIVPVPKQYRYACSGAEEKCRYIWRTDGAEEE